MSHSIFAHSMYGVQFEMTSEESDLFEELQDARDTADNTEIIELQLNLFNKAVASRLTKQYKLSRNNCMYVHVINEADVMEGSDQTDGCIFGVGFTLFPEVCDKAKNRLDLAKLKEHGAGWHSWVT